MDINMAKEERMRTRRSTQGMGNNISMTDNVQLEFPGSPKLTTPLPSIILSKEIVVPKINMMEEATENPKSDGNSNEANQETSQENGKRMETETIEIKQIIDMKDFLQVQEEEKLNLVMFAINKLNTTWQYRMEQITGALTCEDEGVLPRLRDCEQTNDTHADRIEVLEEENKRLREDVDYLRGVIQVLDRKTNHLQNQAVDSKARSMANNIVISGLTGDADEEDCKQKSTDFIQGQLRMEVSADEIQVAHRLGEKFRGKDRPMVVKVAPKTRGEIFKYTKNLKGQTNDKNEYFFVDPQLPDELAAQRRVLNAKIKEIKKKNESLSTEHKIKYQVKNKQLVINNSVQLQKISPPDVAEMINLTDEDLDILDKVAMKRAEPITDKKSVFTGYAKTVNNLNDVRLAYRKVKLLHPEADHVIMAYVVPEEEGSCDDGEHFAGLKLKSVLKERNLQRTVVLVAREFGKVRLGARRYANIIRASRDVLDKLQN